MGNKLYQRETTKEVQDGSGRVITTTESKTFAVKKSTEHFYMVYFENLSGFYKLTSATDIKVLSVLCGKAEFNTGVIELSTNVRELICTTLGIINSQLSRSLKTLSNKGLLTIYKGSVEINHNCFWKGSTETRNKLIKEGRLELRIKFTDNEND